MSRKNLEMERKSSLSLTTETWNEDCVKGAKRRLADGSVDLIITDPPYGIGGDKLDKHYNRNESFVVGDYVEIPEADYYDFSRRWIAQAERVLKPGGSFYLVTGWTNLRHILNALAETRLDLRNHIIWKYNFGVFTRRKYVTSHYHILYLTKSGDKPVFKTYSRYSPSEKTESGRSLNYADLEDVWTIDREYKTGKKRHKNELPSELLVKMLQYSSREGDLVCDFFAGSFSTAKVAKSMNRSSVGFEISPTAFEHQVRELARVGWGERLAALKQGCDDSPARRNAPWSEAELQKLRFRFEELHNDGLTKKAAIVRLQEEFERGYFAVLNALKRQGL